jgi:hypothetical protein
VTPFNQLNTNENAASFECEIFVQKTKNEVRQSLSELDDRLRKANNGENMISFGRRILEGTNNKKDEEDKESEENSEENKDEKKTDADKKTDDKEEEKSEEDEEKDDDLMNEVIQKDANYKVQVAGLKDPKSVNNQLVLIKKKTTKSVFIQEIEGFQYTSYFKCKAKADFYYQEVNFKIDCLKAKKMEIKIFQEDKIEKTITYVFSDFFGEDEEMDDKEHNLPEFSYTYSNPHTFIIFRPSSDDCVLRIKSLPKILAYLFLFLISFY